MQTAEIHKRWLDFYDRKKHTVVPSAPLVSDDPTLMFVVAGMVPFVPYLTGVVPAPFPRATSVQKCIRTNDIEEVGRTPRHGTFFQMCGNFSFGDYFKREAISFAWEFLTTTESAGGLGFSSTDLWVTVYKEDNEAYNLWIEISDLPAERIQRLDKDTNFWSTGQPGPAGPSSEIFFDRGPAYGVDGGPATDDDRYVEIWNLVFMQYQITEVKSKTEFTILSELPHKNIDTGLGLERVAFIKQGVDNMYEIDQVRPVLDRAAEIAGVTYGQNSAADVRLRVIADHVRSGLMLIADGVTPGKDGRGYILRRLLRRIVLSMRLLGVTKPIFPELFPISRDAMSSAYPEVAEKFEFISRTAYAEEQTFLRTLSSGLQLLSNAVTTATDKNSSLISGDAAFLLHDTHGFPIELTSEIAAEAGLEVDRQVFETLLTAQRDRAKADAKAKKNQKADISVYQSLRAMGETVFLGYEQLETKSKILGILVDGQPANSATAGSSAELVLQETTLWAEAGGQAADRGKIYGDSFTAEVLDVQKTVPGLIVHTVKITDGTVAVADSAYSSVDPAHRFAAEQAHSATHIVHAALREVLGEQAHQSGSFNKSGYMRLDFAHNEALSLDTRTEIEDISNTAINKSFEVVTRVLPLNEAKAMGAMSLFSEKYGDTVRMVDIGGSWSRELCAGTHVKNSAQIGLINLLSESSVGSANRRVEALVGFDAFKQFAAERALVTELSSSLKAPRAAVVSRVSELAAQLKAAEKKIAKLEAEKLGAKVRQLLKSLQTVGDVRFIAADIGIVSSADELRGIVQQLRLQLEGSNAVVVCCAVLESKPLVAAATTQLARDKKFNAGQLVRQAANILGGGGGGKPDIAQGGGQDPQAIAAALQGVRAQLTEQAAN
ncbi:alanine--tRNA ligase [Canibacter sp. lx-72]|uniref:alanine--tRNA ligase n=1 Tax=Canibacter zhuwentaonis TaxID=2837491 RepID=UPI001BDD76FE|nr:alanine--tRNA ligase [Canibacter zhuwentaonis]MBT1017878.1 alanine--tRNA ligase [Canibacter zhuwentaonis]MBT1035041.1 alanine--tRNA ligase [Canibacter zhuwentaonis]